MRSMHPRLPHAMTWDLGVTSRTTDSPRILLVNKALDLDARAGSSSSANQ